MREIGALTRQNAQPRSLWAHEHRNTKLPTRERDVHWKHSECLLFNRIGILDGASAITHLAGIMQGQNIQGHFSFIGLWLSTCLILQEHWNCETQYFSKLQEKTSWHAWNWPENGIKMKCGELWVPHQHGSTRHLFIFSVASSSIKKLWVYGIRQGGGVG